MLPAGAARPVGIVCSSLQHNSGQFSLNAKGRRKKEKTGVASHKAKEDPKFYSADCRPAKVGLCMAEQLVIRVEDLRTPAADSICKQPVDTNS